MTLFIPPIEDFEGQATHAERALWLLRAPLSDLLLREDHLRRALRLCGFRAGLAYLDAELHGLRSARRDDGGPADLIGLSVARGRMSRIADGLPPLSLGGQWL